MKIYYKSPKIWSKAGVFLKLRGKHYRLIPFNSFKEFFCG